MPTRLGLPMHVIIQLHKLPHERRRDDIEDCDAFDTVWVVYRESVCEACASVVSDGNELCA